MLKSFLAPECNQPILFSTIALFVNLHTDTNATVWIFLFHSLLYASVASCGMHRKGLSVDLGSFIQEEAVLQILWSQAI